jgi:hypothetical protein
MNKILHLLDQCYDVIGGDDIEENRVRREFYYMLHIRFSHSMRTRRTRVPIGMIKEDREILPEFMMTLKSETSITCYKKDNYEYCAVFD